MRLLFWSVEIYVTKVVLMSVSEINSRFHSPIELIVVTKTSLKRMEIHLSHLEDVKPVFNLQRDNKIESKMPFRGARITFSH
jgi:hypothetical protein